MYLFFLDCQNVIVTSLSEEYHHRYKLYQDYLHDSNIFSFQLCTCSGMCILYSFLCQVIQFCPYFTLAKDGLKCNCIYDMFVPVIIFRKKNKKKNDPYASMGKNQKLCHNFPTIYLFSWEGEGNPYVSNPVNTLKSSKVCLLTLKS